MKHEREFTTHLIKWHINNRREFPWRKTEDPYQILVAEYLLQKTPAERVKKVFLDFIEKYPNAESLSKANPIELKKDYRSLGLEKRMDWLVTAMKTVIELHDGEIPKEKATLKSLPGVGEYTASAILCFAFNRNIEIVDVNVIRLITRYFNIPKSEVPNKVKKIIPNNRAQDFNEALLDFPALICMKRPLCHLCVLQSKCMYEEKK